jgi:hypothetical protein
MLHHKKPSPHGHSMPSQSIVADAGGKDPSVQGWLPVALAGVVAAAIGLLHAPKLAEG